MATIERSLIHRMTEQERLARAWLQVRANHGAAGGDDVSLRRFEHRLELNLLNLAIDARGGTYQPARARSAWVSNRGKQRRLTILAVRDRVLQRAALDLLEPRFERSFLDRSFGYRRKRSVVDAVRRVAELRDAGHRYVIDADIQSCFESIDHAILLDLLRPRLRDEPLLKLIQQWMPIGAARGAPRPRGISLGGVISPLLCNAYLHTLDAALERRNIQSVRYADDFVVLCTDAAERQYALGLVQKQLTALRLRLNGRKTRLTDFDEGFQFLGAQFEGRACQVDIEGRTWTFEAHPADWRPEIPDWYGDL
ncbi:MAG: reverse transcriptase domain-containing protein [Chloroflexota bacterium]